MISRIHLKYLKAIYKPECKISEFHQSHMLLNSDKGLISLSLDLIREAGKLQSGYFGRLLGEFDLL